MASRFIHVVIRSKISFFFFKWLSNVLLCVYVCMPARLLSCVPLFVTPWTIACQGSSVHGISQARILEWVAISFSKGSSRTRDWTYIPWVSCICGWILHHWATLEAPVYVYIHSASANSLQSCPTLCNPHRRQPTRLPRPWDSPGNNIGVGCHFLLQCMKVKSESEVAQSCLTLCDPMNCSPPGSSVHGVFQARVLEWGAIAFSNIHILYRHI